MARSSQRDEVLGTLNVGTGAVMAATAASSAASPGGGAPTPSRRPFWTRWCSEASSPSSTIPRLRASLTGWRRSLERLALATEQDYQHFAEIWMPYLRANTQAPQIANAHTQTPGTDQPVYTAPVPSTVARTEHTALLGDREFQNIVLQKRWIQEDILHRYRQMQDEVARIVALLEAAGER